jgi:hypothetical protein
MANFLKNALNEINKENTNEAERMLFGNVSPKSNVSPKKEFFPLKYPRNHMNAELLQNMDFKVNVPIKPMNANGKQCLYNDKYVNVLREILERPSKHFSWNIQLAEPRMGPSSNKEKRLPLPEKIMLPLLLLGSLCGRIDFFNSKIKRKLNILDAIDFTEETANNMISKDEDIDYIIHDHDDDEEYTDVNEKYNDWVRVSKTIDKYTELAIDYMYDKTDTVDRQFLLDNINELKTVYCNQYMKNASNMKLKDRLNQLGGKRKNNTRKLKKFKKSSKRATRLTKRY